jgi:formylglycine-generating enzyme required for sulfatase activity
MLLIAVGCDDSTQTEQAAEIARLQEQVQNLTKITADKAAADKAADKAAVEKAGEEKAGEEKAAALYAAAEKIAAEKATAEKAVLEKALADLKKMAEEAEESRLRAPQTNTIGMTLNFIPSGMFVMGSPEAEVDIENQEHQQKVIISKSFYMQTTEVTQGQWKAVMGTDPWKGKSFVKEGPNYAASYVSWNDAVAYCKKLSEKESKTYRLPTEAEWEYACRAGTETRWSFGNGEKELGNYAWYRENANDIGEQYAHYVGLKNPNAFGLYDMYGNVFEWCHDYYKVYYKSRPQLWNPTGPAVQYGNDRVVRGGSWESYTRYARSAFRYGPKAGLRNFDLGFRLVRELD